MNCDASYNVIIVCAAASSAIYIILQSSELTVYKLQILLQTMPWQWHLISFNLYFHTCYVEKCAKLTYG